MPPRIVVMIGKLRRQKPFGSFVNAGGRHFIDAASREIKTPGSGICALQLADGLGQSTSEDLLDPRRT